MPQLKAKINAHLEQPLLNHGAGQAGQGLNTLPPAKHALEMIGRSGHDLGRQAHC